MGGLIRHNLKKAKGQFISFGIVMMITAVILNISLVLLFQTGNAYDKHFDELNTADISVGIPSVLAYDALADDIAEMKDISDIEKNESLFASASLQEFQGSEFTMNTYFYKLSDERTISKHSLWCSMRCRTHHRNGFLLHGNPLCCKCACGAVGIFLHSRFRYQSRLHQHMQYTFFSAYLHDTCRRKNQTSCSGFIQSVNNNGLIVELTDEGYSNISDTPLYSLNLYLNGEDADSYVNKLNGEYSDYVVNVSNAAKETKAMQAMDSSLITIVAILLFIIIVLIILLILYVIMRSMTSSLKTDFGIYKAMGFTSRQLIVQTVGSITPVVLIESVLSAVLEIAYLPAMFSGIFSVIGAQKNNFEIPAAVLLIMAVILTVVNIVIGTLLCRPIRKITAYSLIKEG